MQQSEIERQKRLQNRINSEAKNLFSRLPVVFAASRAQYQKLMRYAGDLSITEWRTLWDLNEVGSLSVAELALLQHTDHSQVSRNLPAMRNKGWITMRRSQVDGRQMVIELTDAGKAVYENAAPVFRRRRERVRQAFSEEEMATLLSLLERVETELKLPISVLIEEEQSYDAA